MITWLHKDSVQLISYSLKFLHGLQCDTSQRVLLDSLQSCRKIPCKQWGYRYYLLLNFPNPGDEQVLVTRMNWTGHILVPAQATYRAWVHNLIAFSSEQVTIRTGHSLWFCQICVHVNGILLVNKHCPVKPGLNKREHVEAGSSCLYSTYFYHGRRTNEQPHPMVF